MKEMPADMFTYWTAYLNLHKSKHTKQDYQMAMISKVVAESQTGKQYKIDDFLIKFMTEEELEAEQEARDLAFMRRLAAMPGAKHEIIADNESTNS